MKWMNDAPVAPTTFFMPRWTAVIGRPSRLTLLRDLIAYTRKFDDAASAACGDAARWNAEHEPPFKPVKHAIEARPA